MLLFNGFLSFFISYLPIQISFRQIPLHIPNLQPYSKNRRSLTKYMSNPTTKFHVKFTSMKFLFVEFKLFLGRL
ncbi:unnamed protein product [Coffea canephora]|uniref:Uncharacterized protein n=1 Tax=Coffea canephora TaxID=49390 RepID=A0A068UMN7_COFCA|nr:unnamed protein product [Coffea canephora]